jgi:chromosome segregation ATPase
MSAIKYVPRLAVFLAGAAVAALTLPRRERAGMDSASAHDLKQSLAGLESRIRAREEADAARFTQVEARLEEHAAKLADVPSTSQIVAAMEQLLSRTMASLDDRLSTQAKSIEILKTTVSQTDGLLERVLESLDSLQSYSDPAEFAEDPLLSRPAAAV